MKDIRKVLENDLESLEELVDWNFKRVTAQCKHEGLTTFREDPFVTTSDNKGKYFYELDARIRSVRSILACVHDMLVEINDKYGVEVH